MPISYAERKRRREQLLDQLPETLRGRIALRNVEAVSKLPENAQRTLAETLEAGIRVSKAIHCLQEYPDALLPEVLQMAGEVHRQERPVQKPDQTRIPETEDLAELSQLLQSCYPDMPRITAEALARSDLMASLLEILHAQRVCLASQHGRIEFVFVALCGLARKTLEELDQIIAERPVLREALLQSGVYWPGVSTQSPPKKHSPSS